MTTAIWQKCVRALQEEISRGQFNTWIRPLSAEVEADGKLLWLKAPNRFILDWVSSKFLARIRELMLEIEPGIEDVALEVAPPAQTPSFVGNGSQRPHAGAQSAADDCYQEAATNETSTAVQSSAAFGTSAAAETSAAARKSAAAEISAAAKTSTAFIAPRTADALPGRRQGQTRSPPQDATPSRINGYGGPQQSSRDAKGRRLGLGGQVNRACRFDNFVVGRSNAFAQASAMLVAENPGKGNNPLFIYGGVGLGKTHLMHAVGNHMLQRNPHATVKFVDCESFVNLMIQSLRYNAMDDFKRQFRSVDALLLDDVHFLARKERSQEEFFHTFNNLLHGQQQVILTCDRYPKAIDGIEPRLKSRFGSGLAVAIEPPELETRVAILMSKAAQMGLEMPNDAAEFVAQKVCASGRELEGALKKVKACSQFKGREIDIVLVKEALWDLFAQQEKLISIDNIQRTVAEYYKLGMRDMISKRRSRSVTRPRQMAMSLTRELTSHSLPEIGDAFGGRDHTTVLHACRQVANLRRTSETLEDDFNNLMRMLTN